MHVIRAASELKAGGRKVCAAIGMFDGVHLGHRQVLRQTIEDARQHDVVAVAVTFDCHPNSIVAPEHTPPLIYSLTQKLSVIESLGVDTTLLIHFDEAFSRIPGEEFIRGLALSFGTIHSLCVGSAFTFGHKRDGNVDLLKRLGKELGFTVHGLASISLDGKVVSSTRIREAIRHGDLDAASQMLGRTYSLAGKVVRGNQLGRELGFPTANIDIAGLAVPPMGVYAVRALVQGQPHHAVANLGTRPTLKIANPRPQFEVHILDFDTDLYGTELEVAFLQKLREEQKFASPGALREQIARDIEAARRVF